MFLLSHPSLSQHNPAPEGSIESVRRSDLAASIIVPALADVQSLVFLIPPSFPEVFCDQSTFAFRQDFQDKWSSCSGLGFMKRNHPSVADASLSEVPLCKKLKINLEEALAAVVRDISHL